MARDSFFTGTSKSFTKNWYAGGQQTTAERDEMFDMNHWS